MSVGQNMSDQFFSAYAAGTLDPALTLLIETQAALREDVRRKLHVADAIAGVFLENETPAHLTDGALMRALGAIDELGSVTALNRKAAKTAGNILDELIRLPEPLKDKVLAQAGQSGMKFAGPGLKTMTLDVASEAKVELLRIEPGCGAPKHTHDGNEYTLVVAGGFTDEKGSYGPGDLSIAGPEDLHQPIADPGEVCYALAVTDGSLKFTGWLGIAQKIFG